MAKTTQKELIESLTKRIIALEQNKWELEEKVRHKIITHINLYANHIDVWFKTPWYVHDNKMTFSTKCCYEVFMRAKGWKNL